jgi:hypothetical protein
VVSISPARITAVLPPGFAATGAARISLEATYDGTTLHSNAVEVQW